ncbi:MAG: metallophosphatase family protein [Kiritimatiellae bacterium]|nr:metallophosphatase family protein [Kiritimatiellia bacterium]
MGKVYAILGDIHANIDALEAVLADAQAQGVTDYVSVGDVVGYNAAPAECIRMVRDELKCPVVRGNHDHYVSYVEESLADFHPMAAAVVEWTRSQLSADDIQWLHDLPLSKPVMGFTIVHSTLDMPDHWGYVFDNLQAESNFVYQRTQICFHGHTHVPIIYEKRGSSVMHFDPVDFKVELGQKLFINVGSVGQPRDGDPRASYVIFDTAARTIRFRRLEYDVAAAQARIRAAYLPERLAQRLEVGR